MTKITLTSADGVRQVVSLEQARAMFALGLVIGLIVAAVVAAVFA